MKVKCNEIKVANRIRKDLGDINELADNIKALGLLQPIGITKDNELVFGERRLAACKSLNHEEIEVVIIDSNELLECETTENVNRKNFVMSERVAIRVIFKDKFIREKGIMMAKGQKVPNRHLSKTRDRLAKLSGVGHDTAKKEDYIVAHNDRELIDKVDKNELSVNKAYSLIQKIKENNEVHLNNEESKSEVHLNNNENLIDKKDTPGAPEFFNVDRNIKLTKTLDDEIVRQSDELGMSVSLLIRSILEQYFKQV